jgi:hypothetical protein
LTSAAPIILNVLNLLNGLTTGTTGTIGTTGTGTRPEAVDIANEATVFYRQQIQEAFIDEF